MNASPRNIRAFAALAAFLSVAALATQAFATISNPAADQRMLIGTDVVTPGDRWCGTCLRTQGSPDQGRPGMPNGVPHVRRRLKTPAAAQPSRSAQKADGFRKGYPRSGLSTKAPRFAASARHGLPRARPPSRPAIGARSLPEAARETLDHASAEPTHEMPREKTLARRNRARRFNTLIDTHYEARSLLVAPTEGPLEERGLHRQPATAVRHPT